MPAYIYPQSTEEQELSTPSIPEPDVLRYVGGSPRPENGPGQFVDFSVLTRPQGVTIDAAKQQGFINYLNAYDQAKRDADAVASIMQRESKVKDQLDAIEAARKYIGMRNLQRDIDSGIPLAQAYQKNIAALSPSVQNTLLKAETAKQETVPPGTRRAAIESRLKEIRDANATWPPPKPTRGGIPGLGWFGLNDQELAEAKSDYQKQTKEYNELLKARAKIAGVPIPEDQLLSGENPVVQEVTDTTSETGRALAQPQSWSPAMGASPVSGVQAATDTNWEVVNGKLVRVGNGK